MHPKKITQGNLHKHTIHNVRRTRRLLDFDLGERFVALGEGVFKMERFFVTGLTGLGLSVDSDILRVMRGVSLIVFPMDAVAATATFDKYSNTGAKTIFATKGGMELPNALDVCRSVK